MKEMPPTLRPTPPTPRDSIPTIVSDLVGSSQLLVQQEVERVKAEATERVEAVKAEAQEKGKGAGLLAGGGVFAVLGLAFLGVALLFGLQDLLNFSTWLSALIVTLLYFIIAAVLAFIGRRILSQPSTALGDDTHETQ
jgi:hypothetical protein